MDKYRFSRNMPIAGKLGDRAVERYHRGNVKCVLLQQPRAFNKDSVREKALAVLRDNMALLEKNGIEPAAFVTTIGYGAAIEQSPDQVAAMDEAGSRFTPLTDFYGRTNRNAYCPENEAFVESIIDYIKDIARTGIKLIMLDDDFCLNIRPGLGCACETHMELYRKRLGENIQRNDLANKVFVGGPNRYRDVWMELMGDTLRKFARKLRAAVNEVDPAIRMGLMVSYTNWDLEGATALEIGQILAGQGKPILRLAGAPYWVSTFQRFRHLGMELPAVIEFNRLQAIWCEETDITLFDENDCFPCTTVHCPATLDESFDLCLTAATGNQINGCYHHYCFTGDRPTGSKYDSGYDEAVEHSQPLTDFMLRNFSGAPAGLRVYEAMRKVAYMDFPESFAGQQSIMDTAFSAGQIFAANLSIPTKLKGNSNAGLAFGVVPHFMSEDEKCGNLILDACSAKEMIKEGYDIGCTAIRDADAVNLEFFPEEELDIELYYFSGKYYEFELKENAEVLSWFHVGSKRWPAVYRYENLSGARFLVYTFDAQTFRQDSDVLVSRPRQRQLLRELPWLGVKLPIECANYPGLYFITRQDDNKLSVAACNASLDWVWNAEITTDREYHVFAGGNCTGEINGNSVHLQTNIPPYGFICFTLEC